MRTVVSGTPTADIGTRPRTPAESHRPQLDGIRGIAVLMVMVQHYIPETTRLVELGGIGVRVFFVLSGFLITGILLKARDSAHKTGQSKTSVLGSFYARRFLRIFPLYYAVLVIAALAGAAPVRSMLGWHVAYLSNVYFYAHGIDGAYASHLWSLAVEEQFYLIWPCLILFIPRTALMPLIVSAIALGPITRFAIMLNGGDGWQMSILMPACLDTLGLGALLALLSTPPYAAIKRRLLSIAAPLGLASFTLVLIALAREWEPRWCIVVYGLCLGLWSIWLIDRAWQGIGGVAGRLLQWQPLVYLGTISYGLYIIHNFVGGVANWAQKTHGAHLSRLPVRLTVLFGVTLALASLSWYFFEAPINGLKRYFPYTRRRDPAGAGGSMAPFS